MTASGYLYELLPAGSLHNGSVTDGETFPAQGPPVRPGHDRGSGRPVRGTGVGGALADGLSAAAE
jgi:hypothetical protein